MTNFSKALEWVLEREGGFARLAGDEVTNLGVKKSTWEAWVMRPVTDEEMKTLSVPAVAPLYEQRYWEASSCHRYNSQKIALAVFDFAVHSGPMRAVMEMQHILDLKEDGVAGDKTVNAVNGQTEKWLIHEYLNRRLNFLKNCRNYRLYGKGWENRVKKLAQFIGT